MLTRLDLELAALFIAAGVITGLGVGNHLLQNRLDTSNRSIGQLQGSIQFPNAAINAQGATSKRQLAAATKLVGEAVAGRAPLEAEIARLKAAPAPVDDSHACEAADALILGVVGK